MQFSSPFTFVLFAASWSACDFAPTARADEIAITRDVEYARRGESPAWVKDELKDPMFSSVLGIFQFGLRTAHEHALPPRRRPGLLSNLTKIFASS